MDHKDPNIFFWHDPRFIVFSFFLMWNSIMILLMASMDVPVIVWTLFFFYPSCLGYVILAYLVHNRISKDYASTFWRLFKQYIQKMFT